MPSLSFLWHLHQPAYRTADGVAHAPWVALHAGGAYTTLASAILDSGGRGHVVNIVPTLLEQLLAYDQRSVRDPMMELVARPVDVFDRAATATLIDWACHLAPRQLQRSPRLAELHERAASSSPTEHVDDWNLDDLLDVQVLLILAHAGDQAWRDPRLEPLAVRGRGFDRDDHRSAVEWLDAQPGELIERWRRVADLPSVEISTCPYAHPIVPLLIDTSVVTESWAPRRAPKVPRFRRPEDSRRQLRDGLEFMRRHGFAPTGCWPPEGSVSAAALGLYGEQCVTWLVTDEEILERSLARPLRDNGHADPDLYRPWRHGTAVPTLFFRDRVISDRIGFEYGRWEDEAEAAADLVHRLLELAKSLPDDAAIVLALDGENPWPHYPACGGVFLRELMSRVNHAGPALRPATLSEVAAELVPGELPRLHPGSWIHGTFSTWIGHPEKTAAWRLLAAVRDAMPPGEPLPPSMLLAEGSDWFWWLGDDNPTELAPLYDEIFRRHLADACVQAGIEPPVDLDSPLKSRP
jgi:alpha-amylase/alpha-mannosidase (GH57 family)